MLAADKSSMKSRTTAKIVGGLYLLGFVFGLVGASLSNRGELSTVSAQSMFIAIGALLWIAASMGDFAHGVLMFPILSLYSTRIALGYLGARTIQACLILFSTLFILLQIPIGKDFVDMGSAHATQLGVMSELCLSAQRYTYHIGMLVLAIAGMLLCYGALKASLFSRAIASWGLFGYFLFFLGSMLEIMKFDLHMLHTIVGGLWEICIGFILIFYGFNKSSSDAILNS